MSLCVLFGQQWHLSWNSPMDAVFAQSLSYCWIMNTDLNWGKWGLQFFRCCSRFLYYLLDDSSLRSWSNFGRSATPGKVHHCSKFSPFVDNDHSSLESQSLRNQSQLSSKPQFFNAVCPHTNAAPGHWNWIFKKLLPGWIIKKIQVAVLSCRPDLGIVRPLGHIRPSGYPWPARVR